MKSIKKEKEDIYGKFAELLIEQFFISFFGMPEAQEYIQSIFQPINSKINHLEFIERVFKTKIKREKGLIDKISGKKEEEKEPLLIEEEKEDFNFLVS